MSRQTELNSAIAADIFKLLEQKAPETRKDTLSNLCVLFDVNGYNTFIAAKLRSIRKDLEGDNDA